MILLVLLVVRPFQWEGVGSTTYNVIMRPDDPSHISRIVARVFQDIVHILFDIHLEARRDSLIDDDFRTILDIFPHAEIEKQVAVFARGGGVVVLDQKAVRAAADDDGVAGDFGLGEGGGGEAGDADCGVDDAYADGVLGEGDLEIGKGLWCRHVGMIDWGLEGADEEMERA